jgi:hypothetical protein
VSVCVRMCVCIFLCPYMHVRECAYMCSCACVHARTGTAIATHEHCDMFGSEAGRAVMLHQEEDAFFVFLPECNGRCTCACVYLVKAEDWNAALHPCLHLMGQQWLLIWGFKILFDKRGGRNEWVFIPSFIHNFCHFRSLFDMVFVLKWTISHTRS